ncbi:ATP-binding cassette domain-containing protein [Ruminococcus flavefaciens]|uniref:ATP-binding cassette domain-containing protein n=1 Tax=Ruminococcus flavefaciens TaxID=1265 RepID=UPI0004ACDC1D
MGVIELRNIHKEYNNTEIIKGVNISIESGEFVSIVGPSGSGKSTLMYIADGIEQPTSGEVLIQGENINKLKTNELDNKRCSTLGFVFQFFNLVDNLTVRENIILPAVMSSRKKSEINEQLERLVEITGLKNKLNAFPGELSGGQQQRVAIARALINKPEIIFADEPTGNLDSKTGNEIMELLLEINKTEKATVVQVTHNNEMALMGSRVITIKDGLVLEDRYL